MGSLTSKSSFVPCSRWLTTTAGAAAAEADSSTPTTTTAAAESSTSLDVLANDSSSAASTDEKNYAILPVVGESKKQQWPCANCHSMVESDQVRCSNCHGIQVKIQEASSSRENYNNNNKPHQQPTFVYLERVVSPNPSIMTSTPLNKELLELDTAKTEDDSSEDDDDNSTTSDDDDYETLEASPRHDIICESDESRPVDPVAVTLASVPSPIPAALKFQQQQQQQYERSSSASTSENNKRQAAAWTGEAEVITEDNKNDDEELESSNNLLLLPKKQRTD